MKQLTNKNNNTHSRNTQVEYDPEWNEDPVFNIKEYVKRLNKTEYKKFIESITPKDDDWILLQQEW